MLLDLKLGAQFATRKRGKISARAGKSNTPNSSGVPVIEILTGVIEK